MPYVEGVTLRERLEHGPLDCPAAAVIVEQLGAALAAAHSENVVHRDIKPENIMLQPIGSGGAAKDCRQCSSISAQPFLRPPEAPPEPPLA